jgi:hypothetical protein
MAELQLLHHPIQIGFLLQRGNVGKPWNMRRKKFLRKLLWR